MINAKLFDLLSLPTYLKKLTNATISHKYPSLQQEPLAQFFNNTSFKTQLKIDLKKTFNYSALQSVNDLNNVH
jgi:hypothetical protein